jgi:hypothetical protein
MKPLFVILPLCLAASACGQQLCTLIALPAVSVTIVDSMTGSPVSATVTVIATHGPYADTAIVPPPSLPGPATASLAEERAGFYRVEARAPGYALWTSPLLHVRQGDCHVETVAVTARLVETTAN